MRRTLRAACVCLSLCSGTAIAQGGAGEELVPRKLVEALLSGTSFGYGTVGRPELLVGTLPASVQSKIVLPAGAKVLGGMNTGEMALGVILLDGPLNTAAENFSRDLLKNGWEVADQGPDMFFGNGFIDAPSSQRRVVSGAPDVYCGRGGTLHLKYDPEGFSQTRAVVISMAVNQCAVRRDAMLQSRMGGFGGPGPSRPILVNPGGARNQMGLCPSYNMGYGSRGTELNSQLTPQEILSHYAKQMADSGWKSIGTGVSMAWTKTDTSGTVAEYQITVRTLEGSPCRKVDAELRATRRR